MTLGEALNDALQNALDFKAVFGGFDYISCRPGFSLRTQLHWTIYGNSGV